MHNFFFKKFFSLVGMSNGFSVLVIDNTNGKEEDEDCGRNKHILNYLNFFLKGGDLNSEEGRSLRKKAYTKAFNISYAKISNCLNKMGIEDLVADYFSKIMFFKVESFKETTEGALVKTLNNDRYDAGLKQGCYKRRSNDGDESSGPRNVDIYDKNGKNKLENIFSDLDQNSLDNERLHETFIDKAYLADMKKELGNVHYSFYLVYFGYKEGYFNFEIEHDMKKIMKIMNRSKSSVYRSKEIVDTKWLDIFLAHYHK